MTTLIVTAKLNNVDPLAWLADVLARIAGMPQSRLPELLPWNWLLRLRPWGMSGPGFRLRSWRPVAPAMRGEYIADSLHNGCASCLDLVPGHRCRERA